MDYATVKFSKLFCTYQNADFVCIVTNSFFPEIVLCSVHCMSSSQQHYDFSSLFSEYLLHSFGACSQICNLWFSALVITVFVLVFRYSKFICYLIFTHLYLTLLVLFLVYRKKTGAQAPNCIYFHFLLQWIVL